MRKYINPVPAGGAPLANERFQDVLGGDLWLAIESILQSVSNPAGTGNTGVIVSGCVASGGGPYNMTAGIVYLNGQYMAAPAQTSISFPAYIVPATLVNVQKTFADGASKNLITQQDASYVFSVPGGGQYITISTTGNLGSIGGFRVENYIGPNATTQLAVLSSSKSNKSQGTWNNLTLQNGWTDSGTTPFSYRLTDQNILQIRGVINSQTRTGLTIATNAIFTLPNGGSIYRPIYEQTTNTTFFFAVGAGIVQIVNPTASGTLRAYHVSCDFPIDENGGV